MVVVAGSRWLKSIQIWGQASVLANGVKILELLDFGNFCIFRLKKWLSIKSEQPAYHRSRETLSVLIVALNRLIVPSAFRGDAIFRPGDFILEVDERLGRSHGE